MAPPLGYPLINSRSWDFASITLNFPPAAGMPPLQAMGVKSIDYSNERTPGKAYGTSPAVIARGRGQVKAEGSIDLYAWFDAYMLTQMAAAFPNQGSMEWTFTLTIQYADYSMPTRTDILPGVQFTGAAQNHREGNDLLLVKRKIDIMPYVIENGIHPITGPNGSPFFNQT